jgi:hypothetical protein
VSSGALSHKTHEEELTDIKNEGLLIRHAAQRLDDLAAGAGLGPWRSRYEDDGTADMKPTEWSLRDNANRMILACPPEWSPTVGNANLIEMMNPRVVRTVADLMHTAVGHEPQVADDEASPWGCLRCGTADGEGPCDVWLDAVALAIEILGPSR